MGLEIRDLHKTFGQTRALDGMTFTPRDGELYGFVGSNGAGKTTTMRIILGLLDADSGTVTRDGEPITSTMEFGYMPEERGLYPKMRVDQQLIYLARLHGLSRSDAKQAMEYWTDRLGVAARRTDQVQALSLGNQQRVQLAAALIHNPQVMILDEPFSGLDPLAVTAMSEVLKEKVAEGATVVFSSHQLDLVERLCDRVGICSLGKIVSEGSIADLRQSNTGVIEIIGSDLPALTAALRTAGYDAQVTEGAVWVNIPAGVNDQTILQTALTAGAVHSFTPRRPHLTELFQDVVQQPTPEPAPPAKKRGLGRLFSRKK
ncbi:MAG: ATP-binding cassette domain-containing protein [Trueperella sp.]|nr:ATP-binding cassette domain-containing protein [Trueperella sp.]